MVFRQLILSPERKSMLTSPKLFIAGHNGIVGSALVRKLRTQNKIGEDVLDDLVAKTLFYTTSLIFLTGE
jgi:hypothetical protein